MFRLSSDRMNFPLLSLDTNQVTTTKPTAIQHRFRCVQFQIKEGNLGQRLFKTKCLYQISEQPVWSIVGSVSPGWEFIKCRVQGQRAIVWKMISCDTQSKLEELLGWRYVQKSARTCPWTPERLRLCFRVHLLQRTDCRHCHVPLCLDECSRDKCLSSSRRVYVHSIPSIFHRFFFEACLVSFISLLRFGYLQPLAFPRVEIL